MTNYFRMDGWVKAATGAAIPGAQIYVCTQPANAVALPPSPLANIFSDVNGLVPITQPILTDGFGHYDFYAQAAAYTIVVGFAGQVQQVYPDQSLGAASGSSGGGGGTALALQVNGTPNGNQLLLNLAGAQSTTVADNGVGTVTITGATFKTNGATNTLQSVFNLKSGTGISLAADGVGGVTVTSTVTGIASGQNVLAGLVINSNSQFTNAYTDSAVNSGSATKSFVQVIPSLSLLCTPSSWKVSIKNNGAATVTCQMMSTAIGSSTVVATVNVTFNGGQTSPTFSSTPAIQTSDTISFPIDYNHDYYFVMNSSSGLINQLSGGPATAVVGFFAANTNVISASTITFTGLTPEVSHSVLYSFTAA